MAAYLDAWFIEAPDDAAGIARALGDIARARGFPGPARAAVADPQSRGQLRAHPDFDSYSAPRGMRIGQQASALDDDAGEHGGILQLRLKEPRNPDLLIQPSKEVR